VHIANHTYINFFRPLITEWEGKTLPPSVEFIHQQPVSIVGEEMRVLNKWKREIILKRKLIALITDLWENNSSKLVYIAISELLLQKNSQSCSIMLHKTL